MFSQTHQTRFAETDALGHINNTVVPVWFEAGRDPVFKIFNPELNLKAWNLIIAKIEVNYTAQIHYNQEVTIQTHISRIGGSSFNVYQEVLQNGSKVAHGECVMVKFDYTTNKSVTITDSERSALEQHKITL